MADFCFQCSVDLCFGPYSDFVQKDGHPPPEGFGYPALCEGCGPTVVDERGHCIGQCMFRHRDIPPERREVYESAQRWADRRSGPLGPLLHLWGRYMGTPWEPGYRHSPGHWLWYLIELYRSLRDDRPMQRVKDYHDSFLFTEENRDNELNGS